MHFHDLKCIYIQISNVIIDKRQYTFTIFIPRVSCSSSYHDKRIVSFFAKGISQVNAFILLQSKDFTKAINIPI